MTRFAAVLVLTCFALYGANLGHFFVSDDFLNFERNSFETVADALGFFATKDIDFYRPIPRLHFGFFAGFFGDRVVWWNLGGCALHAIAAVAATLLAGSLLGPRLATAARWAGLFFAVHFIHVEPVLWASGVTSMYVTTFVFLALFYFRRARRTGSGRDRTLSVLAFAAALLSKETAVAFVPLLLLTTAVWPQSGWPRRPRPSEAAPFLILLAAYLVVVGGIDRGGDASPYRLVPGSHVVKNVSFFLAGGFLPLRFWEIRDLWADSVGSGLGFLAALGRRPGHGLPLLVGAGALAWAAARGSRDVRGGLGWILAAATPFLFLPGSGERFQYLSSFGACLVLGCAAAALPRARWPGRPWGGRLLLGALVALHLAGNLDRQSDWRTAARWTREIRDRWGYLKALDPDRPIEFVGIPDHYRSAWVFRNGFDSMVRIYWEGRPYTREQDPPLPGPEPLRMLVRLDPRGTVGMVPAHLLGPP